MDKKLKDAKANLGEAKDDLKVMIDENIDAAQKNISGHVDKASGAAKDALDEMAKSVKRT